MGAAGLEPPAIFLVREALYQLSYAPRERRGDCTVGAMSRLVDQSAPTATRDWRPRIAAGELSPVEAVAAAVDRAIAVQPELNCFTAIWVDEAMLAADRAEQAVARGGAARRAARRAGRREGHDARRRPPHDARLVRLRALGARSRRRGRHRAAPGRRRDHRPDHDPGVRPHAADRQPAVGGHPQPPRSRAARPAARPAAAGRPSPRAAWPWPRAATWADRCASRRRGAASSGSSPASAGSRWTCCRDCSTRSPTTARWPAAPTTPGCSSPPPRGPTTPTSCRCPVRSTWRDRSTPTSPACAWHCRSTSAAGRSTPRSPQPSTAAAERLEAAGATIDVVDPGFTAADEEAWGVLWAVFMAAYYGDLLEHLRRSHGPRRRPADHARSGGQRPSTHKRLEIHRTGAVAAPGPDPRRARRPAVPDDGRRALAGRPRRPPADRARPTMTATTPPT